MSKNLVISKTTFVGKASPALRVVIENGKITRYGAVRKPDKVGKEIDAEGRIAVPGLIDVHIQGAGGADVLDNTEEALRAIARTSAQFGATGFLATTVYHPGQPNQHLETCAKWAGKNLGGARLLGIHLEGPFISRKKRGMIRENCIMPPDTKALDEILRLCDGKLAMMTIAPEIEGADELIRMLVDAKAVPSLGHTQATYDHTLRAFDQGVNHVTHLFNAMPSMHHREPGPLTAIFESDHVTAQLIPDGVHVHPSVVRTAYSELGRDRTVLITNGMQAIGLPEGNYVYNGLDYESKNGTARYTDGTLIGTSLGLSELMLRFQQLTGCVPADAVHAAAATPARVLGLSACKGRIEEGFDADLVILDRDGSVWMTIVGGEIVYRKD